MMITLSNAFGWNFFADWSSENTLKNFPDFNIENAMTLAWNERYNWSPTGDEEIASHQRNVLNNYYYQGVAYWWLALVPHVKTNGKYVIYDGETPPSGTDSGYGWKGIAVKGDTNPIIDPSIILPVQNSWYDGNSYLPASILWPYALSVAEMEDFIGDAILPYPYNWPLFSAKYYLQFYKIINAIKHRLYYAAPSIWFTGLEDNTWSNISQSALITLLSQQNIYSVDVYEHYNNPGFYDAHLKTIQSNQTAQYSENVYIRLTSPNGAVLWPATGEYTFYKHFEPDDVFSIDPPQIPAIPESVPFSQSINLVSLEDRAAVADNFIFQSP
jgi:hypothetical protein